MAKLYFKYGTMKSGKSLDLIRTYDTYERQAFKAEVIYPSTDTRAELNTVVSRMVDPIPAKAIEVGTLKEFVPAKDTDVVLVDEVQFFNARDIMALVDIVDLLDIPVVAYGLKTDFKTQLFEGSKTLIEQADKVEEIKTICRRCGRKATHNMRVDDKRNFVHDGDQISIGSDFYEPVCRPCYYEAKGPEEE